MKPLGLMGLPVGKFLDLLFYLHIKVVVGLLVVLRTVWIFNNFDIIYLITGGGPSNATTTLPIFAYNLGWGTNFLGVPQR